MEKQILYCHQSMKTIRAKWPKVWAKLDVTQGNRQDLIDRHRKCSGLNGASSESVLSAYARTGKMSFEDFVYFSGGRLSTRDELSGLFSSGYISKWEVEVFEHIRSNIPKSWRIYSQARFLGCRFSSDLLVVANDARMFVVELDGAQHEERAKKERDVSYDKCLLDLGIPVIRVGYGYFVGDRKAALNRLLSYFSKLSLKTSVRASSPGNRDEHHPPVVSFIYFQTTGLKKTAAPVDICIRVLRGGEISAEVYSLVNCGIPIDDGAVKCHGITNCQIEGAPSLGQLLQSAEVSEIFQSSRVIFVFDLSFFGEIISRTGGLPDNIVSKLRGVKETARTKFGIKGRTTIKKIAESCGIDFPVYTRFDSQSYCSLLIEMVNRLST